MRKSKSVGQLPSDTQSDLKEFRRAKTESVPTVFPNAKKRTRIFSHEPVPRVSLLHLPAKLTLDGTFNFFIFCLLSGAVPLLISRYEKDGNLWKYWQFLSAHTERWWIAFLIWWSMALFTVVTFVATKLESNGVISRSTVFNMYIFTQLSIAIGASSAAYYFRLPPFMAGGTIMQLIVHMMKVHSYWDTNRLLRGDRRVSHLKENSSSVHPKHVTLWNYLHFLSAPTLTYEMSYPLTSGIRPRVLIKETVSAAASLFLLMVLIVELLVEQFPRMCAQNALLMIVQLTLPCMLVWCVAFYAVFHCICNFAAELTRFADREFYSDWWNAQNFDEWWKRWNKPVHEWFLRHVYMQLQAVPRLDKNAAAVISFMISAVLHEIVIVVAFGLVPPFLLVFMMLQLVLIFAGRKSMLTGYSGNLIMWAALFIGQPILILLYVRSYMSCLF